MFKRFRKHNVILVTGPQRSGTRITAKAIAQDTGHEYVDEKEFGNSKAGLFHEIIEERVKIVVHCPAMAYRIHKVKDVFVVFVKRNIEDIALSQERVGGYYKKSHYKRYLSKCLPKELFDIWDIEGGILRRSISRVAWPMTVYNFWETVQKPIMKDATEVDYESLRNHPLWIDKAQRVDFKPEQTKN